jgi:hypothetical protein
MYVILRQCGIQRGHELPGRADRVGVGIYRVNIETAAQKIWKIATGAAASVEHAPAIVESPAKELIE